LRAGRLPGIEVEGKRGLVISGAGPGLGELSSRSGLTSVIPKTRAAWMISSADG